MTGPSPNPLVRDLLSLHGRISSRLRALESLLAYGLPDDYHSKYVPAIQAVGAAPPSIS